MENILIAVDNRINSKLIAGLLKNNYNIQTYNNDIEINSRYDLIITDGKTLSAMLEKHADLKPSGPVFRPVLFVSSKKGISLITNRLWQVIDGLITTPISKMELFATVEILLRARRQSIELHRQSLTLENKLDVLKRESSMLTDYFANMSHELRTPLAVIISSIDFLSTCFAEDLIKPETCSNTLEITKRNCQRLLRIFNNLLDITKIKSGYMNLSMRNIDIHKKIAEIVDSVQEYAKKKEITLNFLSDACTGLTADDEDMLDRILLNLLSNAIKYTPEHGVISVILQESPNHDKMLVSVKDNGIGIPAEKQHMIFDRFAQVDDSMTKRSEGCGLGLSLAKSLVELHEGRIWVESKPGLGSKFCFELPVLTVASDLPQRYLQDINERIYYEFSDL